MSIRAFLATQFIVILATVFLHLSSQFCVGDGLVVKKRSYDGSLEEASQEAVIIFRPSETPGEAIQDLILSIEVHGNAREFAWVVPFPNEPQTFQEDPGLFQELFDYVEYRRQSRFKTPGQKSATDSVGSANSEVEVLSRNVVGDYEVTIVRETAEGGLNPWLAENEFQPLKNANNVLAFYREHRYVYACIRYTSEALAEKGKINSHPLRFRFKTGGTDGMYFPMKLTGLQEEPFDVTLYVFTPSWINDKLNQFGFLHRGFFLSHRDWDTSQCTPNAGKVYSSPSSDPYLKRAASRLTLTSELFQALYPGQPFYLTKIQAYGMNPEKVRNWSDDLWLFPYYTRRRMVPYDARKGGVASAAWPGMGASLTSANLNGNDSSEGSWFRLSRLIAVMALFTAALIMVPLVLRRVIIGPRREVVAGNVPHGKPHPSKPHKKDEP